MRYSDFDFDFKNPDYVQVFKKRIAMLNFLRQNPQKTSAIKLYYRDNPIDFINDWGCTFDPRNAERELPSFIPFLLMPKQEDWVEWLINHWREGKSGIVEKSRTVGMSWLAIAISCALCLFNPGIVIGFGSRKQEYVDVSGDLKAIFPKIRLFLKNIPKEFLNGFDINKNAPFMRVLFTNGSQIIGESGDGIGRGARASIYFVDEAAFLERPQLIDASLSETTNCRIDISTPNGFANPFAERRHAGKIDVFTYHWRDDLRRNQEWYEKKCIEIDNPVIIAQELDINYYASAEYIVIPAEWVRAAIDSHIKLGFESTGIKIGALDVADEGVDKNAFCSRHGVLINYLDEWSGKNSDIGHTTQRAIKLCEQFGYKEFYYDADGMGASIKGYVRIANENKIPQHFIFALPFRGSGQVVAPETKDFGDRQNKDFFCNAKSQAWWLLRQRFQNTFNAVNNKEHFNSDNLISISSKLGNILQLQRELSQVTYKINGVGKILIDKQPNGLKSPNLADAVMICFAPTGQQRMKINKQALQVAGIRL